MASDNTPVGFLSRWSRRKTEVREGREVAQPVADKADKAAVPQAPNDGPADNANPSRHKASVADAQPVAQTVATMDDVQQLHAESNFANFMSSKVAPEVKNAALKKLFTDPHFNIMDGLDIYIDDYGKPDPLPEGMLRQMTSIDGLNLFDKKDEGDNPTGQPDVAAPKVVAQSSPEENISTTQPDTPAHDHADLRLQSNPAARPEGSEPKPE